MIAQGRAGGVRDLLALAEVQLLDVRTGLGQGLHRRVADALAAPKRQLTQKTAASSRDVLDYWSLWRIHSRKVNFSLFDFTVWCKKRPTDI